MKSEGNARALRPQAQEGVRNLIGLIQEFCKLHDCLSVNDFDTGVSESLSAARHWHDSTINL